LLSLENDDLIEKLYKNGYPKNGSLIIADIEKYYVHAGKNTLAQTQSARGLYFSQSQGLSFSDASRPGYAINYKTLNDFNREAFAEFLKGKRRNIVAEMFQKSSTYRNQILNEKILSTDYSKNPDTNDIFFKVSSSYARKHQLGHIFVTVNVEKKDIKPNKTESETKPVDQVKSTNTKVDKSVEIDEMMINKDITNQTGNVKSTLEDNTMCDF
jgi:hypothetical protein